MKREITGKLVEWKHSKRRKPLLITGVRQCGKTFTIKDFGAGYYQNMVEGTRTISLPLWLMWNWRSYLNA